LRRVGYSLIKIFLKFQRVFPILRSLEKGALNFCEGFIMVNQEKLDWKNAKRTQQKSGYVILDVFAEGYVWSRLEHIYVWESVNGKIPVGYHIHHKNKIKNDNRIENLQMVTPTEHQRIHKGWRLIDTEWWKPCGKCKTFYLSENFKKCPQCEIVKQKKALNARASHLMPDMAVLYLKSIRKA
jgi:hypothetical protein